MTLSDVAGEIRAHLWRPTTPDSPDSKPWTMARELSIAKRLIASGYSFEELCGAISVVRELRPDWTGPLRLTVFYWMRQGEDGVVFTSTPFLTQCVGLWHKRRPTPAKLPPSAGAVLRGML